MMQGACVAMHGGRLVVVKQATAGACAARLRHEAACLARVDHPGVVELVSAEDLDDGGAVVRTAFVGGGTLAERPPHGPDLARTAEVAASMAATLADLHHQGITHGRVTADHVLVAVDGRAVLCGFAEAVVDGPTDDHRAAAAADVAAVGAVIRELSGNGTATGAAALTAIAARALALDPPARPSMRSLADALQGLVAKAGPGVEPNFDPRCRRLLPRSEPAPSSPLWAELRRPRIAMVGTAVLAVTAMVGLGALIGSPGEGESRPRPPLLSVPDTTTSVPSAPADDDGIERVWPPPVCDAPAAPVVADVDGDGCAEDVHLDDGVVRAGDRRWQVAEPGDVVVVGDWDCDDIATPAVLRPGSGQVWRYPRWAQEDEEVVAALVTTVPGAVDATVERAGVEGAGELRPAGCDHLAVLDADGVTTRIDGDGATTRIGPGVG